MSAKEEKHILALSGGKDSAALAVYMREQYPHIPLEYVFIDSGCELPETYEYLNRIRALLNIKLIIIRSPKNFDYWLKFYKGVLPSASNRWCTRELKLNPYKQWINSNYEGNIIHSYVGLRADETRDGFRPSNDLVIPVHPFVNDGLVLSDILNILDYAGIGLPSYYSWRQRSGCYFCFFQRDSEWKGLRINHPDLFEKACTYEEEHTDGRIFTWRDAGYLRNLSREIKNSVTNIDKKPLLINTLANIKSVVKEEFFNKR